MKDPARSRRGQVVAAKGNYEPSADVFGLIKEGEAKRAFVDIDDPVSCVTEKEHVTGADDRF